MKEYLYSYKVCCDRKNIWVIDFVIHGLVQIDMETYGIKSILSPMELYKNGYFDICKLVDWDEYIVIVPVKANGNWLLYDKVNGKIEYIYPISLEFCCADAARMGNRIFCFPLSCDAPVAVVDLEEKKCSNIINHWNTNAKEAISRGELWTTVKAGDTIYFPIRGSRFIGMTDGTEIKILEIKRNILIGAADFYEGNWWVSDMKGTDLYCFDKAGDILEQIPVNTEEPAIRLIATESFIFMLPEQGSSINVFDKRTKESRKINTGIERLFHILPEHISTAPYWHYMYAEDHIIFLSHEYPCTIINLDSLEIKHREIVYPDGVVKDFYWEFYRYVHKLCRKNLFYEKGKDSIEGYLCSITPVGEDSLRENKIGVMIWKRCVDSLNL